jgi:excisionase family DNA binding protein
MLPDPRHRPWLTVAELAEITGEGEKVLRAAIDAGQIPSVRVGRYIRIPTARLMIEVLGINGTTADGSAAAEPATLGGDTK